MATATRLATVGTMAVSAEKSLPDDEDVENEFNSMDADGDGVISKEEFKSWQHKQSKILMDNTQKESCGNIPCVTDAKRGKFLYYQWVHPNMEPEKGTFRWHRWRLACVMESRRMQITILLLVVANAIFQASSHMPSTRIITEMWQGFQIDMQTEDNAVLFEDIELTILSVFLVEILLKIFGFGLRRYLGYRMNIFDMLVVLLALVGELVAG